MGAVVLTLGLGAGPARAASFDVSTAADAGAGSLRDAITQANAAAGADTITFSTGAVTIDPATALPAITEAVTIDGGGVVELRPSALAAGDGLQVAATGVTIRGLTVAGFPGAGIRIAGSNTVVGGIGAGEGNTISGNGGAGVAVVSGSGNTIRGNVFTGNGGGAISLGAGANGGQAAPVLSAVTVDNDAGTTRVQGTLSAAASASYEVDVYSGGGCGGQAAALLGSATVVTDGAGAGTLDLTLPSASPEPVVATATGPGGSTSALSAPRAPQVGVAPACDPLALATAIAHDPAQVTGAAFVTRPAGGTPNGIVTTALGGFPIAGPSYGVLSNGSAYHVLPGAALGSAPDGGSVRGDTDYDVTVFRVDLAVPDGRTCVSLDFRFLSDEYPNFVGSGFNDAFIAELDGSTWTTSGSVITAPDNFAFDPSGNVISINSTGATAMSADQAAGTGFATAGATPLLRASRVITPGAHQLYLSIFDQGDHALDSAVMVDNVALSDRPPAACVSGASADLVAPVVTITTPAEGAAVADATPAFGGERGASAGDLAPVTVDVHAGGAGGPVVQTLSAGGSGPAWSVDATAPLAPGAYVAVASQTDAAGNLGTSAPRAFTVTAAPTPTPTPAPGLVPVLGRAVVVAPKSGTVRVRRPGSKKFRTLKAGSAIPLGSVVDATRGRVTLTSAVGGGTQTADFYAGRFRIGQQRDGLTDLALVGPTCPRAASSRVASTARKKKKRSRAGRRLWGDGQGRFRTRGKYGTATVQGTKWLTEDRCDGTHVKVVRGVVRVRDLPKHRTVTVKAGKQYLARAKK